ncbi:Protein brambleberry [Dissostichus eleginoides]|uniref:Protein brambleberry n=1 Tax=Dissostichus eleginoides TaxID=100907 RepID=A0AAD9C623_DISEL|nr:Protein brambleberry [Dissostichus eleginoides]
MLLLTVPLNAVCEMNQQPALDLTGLSLLLLLLCLGHWFLIKVWACFQIRGKPATPLAIEEPLKPDPTCDSYPTSSTPQKNESYGFMERDDLLNQNSFISGNFEEVDARVQVYSDHGTSNYSTPRLGPQRLLSAALFADNPPRSLGCFYDSGNISRGASPTPSVISNSSLSVRQLCNGVTKTGKACKKRALPEQEYCRVHEGGYTSYVAK